MGCSTSTTAQLPGSGQDVNDRAPTPRQLEIQPESGNGVATDQNNGNNETANENEVQLAAEEITKEQTEESPVSETGAKEEEPAKEDPENGETQNEETPAGDQTAKVNTDEQQAENIEAES